MSDDDKVIPLRPGLNDQDITELLTQRMQDSCAKADETVEDLNQTIKVAEDTPPYEFIFAYGQMTQYLKTLERAELEHLLAGALWRLAK